MSGFPTAGHLCSWAKFSPGIKSSAGKSKGSGTTGHGNRYLARVLGEAVVMAGRSDTFLGERYRRIARRRGKKKAVVAVGRSMLVVIWHLLSDPDARFHDLGAEHSLGVTVVEQRDVEGRAAAEEWIAGVAADLDPRRPGGYAIADVITFDPAPALKLLREYLPDALYLVEGADVEGDRLVTAAFPDGELTGPVRIVPFEDLLHRPATRVVVRSVEHTNEEFGELVAASGLHGVSYAAVSYTHLTLPTNREV